MSARESTANDPAAKPLPVVIVGAGVAGLVAAVALHEAGVPVHVFEAEDRVGGRMRTDRHADGYILDRGYQVLPRRTVKIKQRQDNPHFAAMVESMDESFGRVMTTLEELHLQHDTIVIFTSDNGGMSAANFGRPRSQRSGSDAGAWEGAEECVGVDLVRPYGGMQPWQTCNG